MHGGDQGLGRWTQETNRVKQNTSLLAFGFLLREKHCVDVRQHAARRNGHVRQELVQLLVVADRQLDMTRDDARLLVVARSVARQLENLGGQVLHDCSEVDGRASADALRVPAVSQVPVDAPHRKLQTCFAGA